MDNERLLKQIDFIVEIDKAKEIFRQNVVIGAERNENDAEHSWHMAVMAILLSEYASSGLDMIKVLKMILIHDLVEIDAGDTFCYDEKANEDKFDREDKAAERIFSILPEDQAKKMYDLWLEFDGLKSDEAKFASCMDSLQPLLLNYNTNGHTWKKPGATYEKVLKRNELMKDNAPILWDYAKKIIKDSYDKGILKR